MKSKINSFLTAAILFTGIAGLSFPQPSLNGSLSGKVLDTESLPIEDVSIMVKGPAMQGMLIYVTDDSGAFHFSEIPPGDDYTIRVEKPEYKTMIYPGISLNMGSRLHLNVTLEASSLEKEIVINEPPFRTDTQNSKLSVLLNRDFLRHLPFSRDLQDILNAAPGAVPDGPVYQGRFLFSGASVNDVLYSVDGVPLNDPLDMHPMTPVSPDVFEEIEFGSAGLPPTMGVSGGGYVNIRTRSGGNSVEGNLQAEYMDDQLQRILLDSSELKAVGLERPSDIMQRLDLSLTLGVPVLQDFGWLFVNTRYFNWEQHFNHVHWEMTQESGKNVFTGDSAPHREFTVFGKVTMRPVSYARSSITYNLASITEKFYIPSLQSNHDPSALNRRNGEIDQTFGVNGEWIQSQNFSLSGRVAYSYKKLPLSYTGSAIPNQPRHYDRYYQIYSNNAEFEQIYNRQRLNPAVYISWFLDDFLGARHHIKAGAEYEWAISHWDFWRTNPFIFHYYQGSLYAYPTPAEPNRTKLFAYTVGQFSKSSIQKNEKNAVGAFIQDSFTFAGRLTFNLGLRLNFSSGSHPDQFHSQSYDLYEIFEVLPGLGAQYGNYKLDSRNVMTWFNLSPRLGLAFDLFGNGRTVLKGNYARYHDYMSLGYLSRVNPLAPQLSSWYWFDDNGDEIPDEEDRFELIDAADDPETFSLEDKLDPDTYAPYTDEFSAGIEHELFRNFNLSLSFIHKHQKNLLEDVNDYGLGKEEAWKGYSPDSPYWKKFSFTDPGEDGVFGTADDSTAVCFAESADSPGERHWYFMNVEEAYRKHTAVQLILHKRMSHNWQLLASLVWSRAWGNVDGGTPASTGFSKAFNTPNQTLFTGGRLDYDRPLNIKIMGSVILPFDFIASAFYQYRSGVPWNRTLTITIPDNDQYLDPGAVYTVPTEEKGSRRTSPLSLLDFRLEKSFFVSGNLAVGGYVDILNVLGQSRLHVEANAGGFLDYSDPDNPVFQPYGNIGDIFDAEGTRTYRFSLRISF